MDQGSDYLRRDIESTRAALDEKLDSLESKARQTFDLNHQVAERPWLALGAAVAAGFVLGSIGGGEEEQRWHGQPQVTTDYNQHANSPYNNQYTPSNASNYTPSSASYPSPTSAPAPSKTNSFLSQFDDEIDMLKTAAIATLTNFLRDSIKEYVPALGQQLDQTKRDRGLNPSTAPGATSSGLSGASKYYDVRESSSTVNNESIPETTYQQSNMADRDAEHATPYYPPGSSGAQSDRDYVKTYGTNRERSVGGETTRS